MKKIFIQQFEKIFGLSFSSVINIENLGTDTNDDGISHYVDIVNKDVYSFDVDEEIWLEKNLYKCDILARLKIS